MVDVLRAGLPLETTTLNNVHYDMNRVKPASDYIIACKHQSDLSKTPSLFHLMLLGVGTTTDSRVDYNNRYFQSTFVSIDGYAS
jgi:hypothetical protein